MFEQQGPCCIIERLVTELAGLSGVRTMVTSNRQTVHYYLSLLSLPVWKNLQGNPL